jgi:hypothetical protein
MVGLAFCIIAFGVTFYGARRSLAAGLQCLLTVGYLYGLVRGRVPDGLSHFGFDVAAFALYVGYLTKPVTPELEHRSHAAMVWTWVLMVLPCVCMAYSPLLEDSQPMVVQLVGLRAWTLMLPCLLLGARLTSSDLDRLAPTFALLNLFALVLAGIEYKFGVAAVIPLNRATELIYISRDITAGSESYHRIPACFVHSAAYGATMLFSIPFLLHGLESKRRVRLLCIAGLTAAILGTFLCGSRTSVVLLGMATLWTLMSLRMRFGTLLGFLLIGAAVLYLATHNERLERFETLSDTDYVQNRIGSSVNSSFFYLLEKYPFGDGLASAFGTSVPFFLKQLITHDAVGIENEYGRILVEEGVFGLALWVGLVGWLITRGKAEGGGSPATKIFGTAVIFISWGTAVMGAGMLYGVPSASILMLLCGMRSAAPAREAVRLALRHVGPRRAETSARRGVQAGHRAAS